MPNFKQYKNISLIYQTSQFDKIAKMAITSNTDYSDKNLTQKK